MSKFDKVWILRKNKVYNIEYNIINFNTKNEYKLLKQEINKYQQDKNKSKYNETNKHNYIMFPKDNHIKYILCGSSGSGKTKNTINILKIFSTLYKNKCLILYFSPIEEDYYRDIALTNITKLTNAKVIFYNCEQVNKLPTLKELQYISINLNENKLYKMICIFDDCESCTNRKILYDDVSQSISKTIYQLINTLSIAGRSHAKHKPTISYIAIQHNILVGGTIKEFNTILLESNLLGFRFNSLTKRNRKYLEEKFGFTLPNTQDISDFIFIYLNYPHYLIKINELIKI